MKWWNFVLSLLSHFPLKSKVVELCFKFQSPPPTEKFSVVKTRIYTWGIRYTLILIKIDAVFQPPCQSINQFYFVSERIERHVEIASLVVCVDVVRMQLFKVYTYFFIIKLYLTFREIYIIRIILYFYCVYNNCIC